MCRSLGKSYVFDQQILQQYTDDVKEVVRGERKDLNGFHIVPSCRTFYEELAKKIRKLSPGEQKHALYVWSKNKHVYEDEHNSRLNNQWSLCQPILLIIIVFYARSVCTRVHACVYTCVKFRQHCPFVPTLQVSSSYATLLNMSLLSVHYCQSYLVWLTR